MAGSNLPSGVVTFLLTDVEQSTVLWERSPAAMDAALRIHDRIIEDEVTAHRGRLLKVKGEGDATFSVFVRATDALAAALAGRRRVRATAWPDDLVLRVRWAVATGEAIERDGDYFGTTVNRVARLRGLAAGDDVLIAQSTVDVVVDHLAPDVRLLDLGQRTLRGLTRPEHVWRVVSGDEVVEPTSTSTSLSPRPPPLPPLLVSAAAGPLVARTEEIRRLVEAVGSPGRNLVLVRGQPGIGKTRLVAEAGRLVHERGRIVLYGRCEDGLAATYRPFVEALRHWSTNAAPDVVESAMGRHRRHIERLLPEIEAGARHPASSGDSDQFALFEAVDHILAAIAARSGLALILDDLHWADRSSLLLLRHLARSPRVGDVTIIATYRQTDLDRSHPLSEVLADLSRDATYERIDLGGLTPDETRSLIGLVTDRLDSEALARAAGEAEGNPFFAVELARHLIESADLLSTGDASVVPEGVREAIGRRLSRLPSMTNEVLAIAAVIGRDFDSRVIAAIAGSATEEVLDALDTASSVGLLEELPDSFGRYRFAHALIRQTLESEMSANRRVRIHWAAGTTIAELHPEECVEVAFHLAEGSLAGDPLLAARWSVTAGRHAFAVTAWDEAAVLFERAIELLESAARGDERTRFDALIGISQSRELLGDFRTPRRAARDAFAIARQFEWDHETVVAALQASRFEYFGMSSPTRQIIEQALAVVTPGTPEQLRLRAFLIGNTAWDPVLAETAWRATCAEAEALVELGDAIGSPGARIDGRTPLGWALASRGLAAYRTIVVGEQRALYDDELPDADTDAWRGHRVAVETGGLAREVADPELLEQAIARHLDVNRRTKAPWLRRSLAWWRCTDALASAKWDEFDAHLPDVVGADHRAYDIVHWELSTRRAFVLGELEAVVDAMHTLGATGSLWPEMSHQLALFIAASGDLEAARVACEAAWSVELTYSYGRPRALSSAAEAAFRLGDVAAAARLHSALSGYDAAILAPYGGHMVDMSVGTARGLVQSVLGMDDEAETSFRAGLAVEERMGYAALAARTRVWWAMLLDRRGDADRAATLIGEAADIARRCELGLVLRDIEAMRS